MVLFQWQHKHGGAELVATIATHNGSTVRQAHNIRTASCLAKEKHIDPSKPHEIWRHETINHAYHRLFDPAREKYNAKQKRQDRKLKGSYLAEIEKNQKKHSCYEMIIGVYGEEVSESISKDIMREFVKGWQDRNPNLELIGAYYHADEEGQNPHVHLDYIPVAHGYVRGPETQTGLVKALEHQGFVKQGRATAQIQWEARENECLDKICQARGLIVEHPQAGNEQIAHLDTKLYKAHQRTKEAKWQTRKAQKETKRLNAEIAAQKAVVKDLRENIGKSQQKAAKAEMQAQEATNKLYDVKGELGWWTQSVADLEQEHDDLRTEIGRLTRYIIDLNDRKGLAEEKYSETEKMAQKADERAQKANDTARKLDDVIRRKFEAIEMARQERPPVKHKIGGKEVVEVDPETYATLQDTAAYVQEAFRIKQHAQDLLNAAEAKADKMIYLAKERTKSLEDMMLATQIKQIREDWPELNKYFDGKGTYRGRNWPTKQKTHQQDRYVSRDDFER